MTSSNRRILTGTVACFPYFYIDLVRLSSAPQLSSAQLSSAAHVSYTTFILPLSCTTLSYPPHTCTLLPRQMLFSVNDVGKLKASAAKESLLKNHNIRTTIEAHVS